MTSEKSESTAEEGNRNGPLLLAAWLGQGHQNDQPGQHKHSQKKRNKDYPIQKKISQVDSRKGPGIGSEQANFGSDEVAVAAQVANRCWVGINFSKWVTVSQVGRNAFQTHWMAMNPRRQPTANVATAGNSREIVKLIKEVMAR